MRSALLSLLLLVGCKDSKEDRCKKVRDQAFPVMQQNVKDALGAVDSEHRAEIEAEGHKELAAFQANFVKVCAAQDEAVLKCFEDGAKDPEAKPSKDCKERTEDLWGAILAP